MNTHSTSSKRVVIINNLNSANIEQAIFILKGSETSLELNNKLICEAQRIIDSYVKRSENSKCEYLYKLEPKPPKRKVVPKTRGKLFKLIAAGVSAAVLIFAVYLANSLISLIS